MRLPAALRSALSPGLYPFGAGYLAAMWQFGLVRTLGDLGFQVAALLLGWVVGFQFRRVTNDR